MSDYEDECRNCGTSISPETCALEGICEGCYESFLQVFEREAGR